MAEMTSEQREELWAECMECMEPTARTTAMSKAEYRAAINAVDTWLNTNRSTLLAIYPSPSSTALTDTEKIQMIADVCAKRVATGVE